MATTNMYTGPTCKKEMAVSSFRGLQVIVYYAKKNIFILQKVSLMIQSPTIVKGVAFAK
jgi:hypothetical protein